MPFLALIVFNIFLATVIVLFCKLTTGICKSNKHLVGKVVIITGANTGIGYETAKNLAERGARVILACRSEERGTAARDNIIKSTGNHDVHYRKLDLASLSNVREFSENILKTEKRIDILINNAGILGLELVKTEDGLLPCMQVNHFAPFLLTNLLLPLLKSSAPSRIINVASSGYRSGVIDLSNLNMEKETEKSYNGLQAYRNTKLCNVLMTVELSRILKGTGVTVNCLNPGLVATNFQNNVLPFYSGLPQIIKRLLMKSPWEGAQTSIYLAVSPEGEDVSGCYFTDCCMQNLTQVGQDSDTAAKLWKMSEELVKSKLKAR